jgi:hypothetical protein
MNIDCCAYQQLGRETVSACHANMLSATHPTRGGGARWAKVPVQPDTGALRLAMCAGSDQWGTRGVDTPASHTAQPPPFEYTIPCQQLCPSRQLQLTHPHVRPAIDRCRGDRSTESNLVNVRSQGRTCSHPPLTLSTSLCRLSPAQRYPGCKLA